MKENPPQNFSTFFSQDSMNKIQLDREKESKKEQEKYFERLLEHRKIRLRQCLVDCELSIMRSWRPASEDRTTICKWFEKNGLKKMV